MACTAIHTPAFDEVSSVKFQYCVFVKNASHGYSGRFVIESRLSIL